MNVPRDCRTDPVPDFSFLQEPENRATLEQLLQPHLFSSKASAKQLRNFIEDLRQAASSGKVVLFIALHRGNFPTIEYVSLGLKARYGIATFAVYLNNQPEAGTFDQTYCCHGSVADLLQVVCNLPRLPVYIQAHARWAFLGLLVKTSNPRLRVVQEVYDWITFFAPIGSGQVFEDAGVFTKAEIALMHDVEASIPRYLDGVIYKNGGGRIQQLLQGVAAMQLMPAPPAQWFAPPRHAASHSTLHAYSLVYAGQVKNHDDAPLVFGDMYLIPVIRNLTRTGIKVDVFSSYSRDEEDYRRQFADYLAEEQSNPDFSIHRGVPVNRLIPVLNQQYDYGMLLYYFEEQLVIGREHIESSLASKLFTYVAAGLPVLISGEFTYMCDIVERMGIGLVVRRGEYGDLPERLRQTDYQALLGNVGKAQEVFNIENSLQQLYEFLL